MLCELPSDQYRVFSGVAPLASAEMAGFEAHTALVHADAATPDLAELIAEMAGRTATGYLFGGLSSSRARRVQFAVGGNGNIKGQGAAGGVFTRRPVGRGVRRGRARWCRASRRAASRCRAQREITAADGNVLLELDGEPALDVLLGDLGDLAGASRRRRWTRVRATLVGLTDAGSDAVAPHRQLRRRRAGAPHHRARPGAPRRGDRRHGARPACAWRSAGATCRPRAPTWCASAPRSARSSSREELPLAGRTALARAARPRPRRSPARRIAGAVYVSCSGRGGPHFGAPERRAADRAPRAGRRAAGRLLRRRRDRPPPPVWLHRRADGVHRRRLKRSLRPLRAESARPAAPSRRSRWRRCRR